MTIFVIVLALLTLVVMLLLSMPLWRAPRSVTSDSVALSMGILREQLQEIDQALRDGRLDEAAAAREKHEIERRAIEESSMHESAAVETAQRAARAGDVGRRALLATVLVVPLLTGGIYAFLGTPAAIIGLPSAGHAANAEASLTPQQIEAMVAKLADKLAANPDDGEGWMMLARSYMMLERFDEAAKAYGKGVAIVTPSADIYADYAEAMALANQRKLSGEPEKLIAKALKLNPQHAKALALSGSVAYERGDFRKAAAEWRKILPQTEPGSEVADSLRESIAEAESRAATQSGKPGEKTKGKPDEKPGKAAR